jgi:hypothetical protein
MTRGLAVDRVTIGGPESLRAQVENSAAATVRTAR